VWAVVHYSFIYIGGRGFETTDMVQKSVSVPVGDAERIRMALHMVYGDLQLEAGTDALLAGSTRYNVVEFAPHVLYEEDGGRGQLLMDHLKGADNTRLFNRSGRVSKWHLAINDHVPIDELEVVVGLGSGHVDLSGIDLRRGTLALLAGDFTVDLRGDWAQDNTVEIQGVTGAITVLLPSETGTAVTVDGGPRTLHVTGLAELTEAPTAAIAPPAQEEGLNESNENDENDKYYANSAYEEGSPILYVQAGHAFGTLNLIVEKREE
jgi:hypothetical protein